MTRKSHKYIDDDDDDENDHKRLVSSNSASTCESDHNAGELTITVPFHYGDENDYKRLESRDSGDSTEVSEHHIGPFTIIRSLDERKHSMYFSDIVITQGEYHHGKPGELFNDFGSQEIHRKSSKKAKFGVALVIIMLLVMLVIVVFCLLSSPPDHSARNTELKAMTNHNNTSTT